MKRVLQVLFATILLSMLGITIYASLHKPLWLAEVGWSALPVDFPGAAIHGRVTLDQQARYTGDALRRIRGEWPWVGVTFLWH